MDPVIQTDYSNKLLAYKLEVVEIQQSIRNLDNSVDRQLEEVAGNLGILTQNTVILVPAEIPSVPSGVVRRIYRRLKRVPGIKQCAAFLKKIKRWMERYQILKPLIRLSEKICR